ncbi:MAG: threonine synthase, partial [Ruminococcus sp.]|nr:threonine synthase [Ruminococcus sp.]
VCVYEDYRKATGDTTKTVIASTASPYKFSGSVLEAVEGQTSGDSEFAKVERLHKLSGYDIPRSLAELESKERRFKDSIERDEMEKYVLAALGLE